MDNNEKSTDNKSFIKSEIIKNIDHEFNIIKVFNFQLLHIKEKDTINGGILCYQIINNPGTILQNICKYFCLKKIDKFDFNKIELDNTHFYEYKNGFYFPLNEIINFSYWFIVNIINDTEFFVNQNLYQMFETTKLSSEDMREKVLKKTKEQTIKYKILKNIQTLLDPDNLDFQQFLAVLIPKNKKKENIMALDDKTYIEKKIETFTKIKENKIKSIVILLKREEKKENKKETKDKDKIIYIVRSKDILNKSILLEEYDIYYKIDIIIKNLKYSDILSNYKKENGIKGYNSPNCLKLVNVSLDSFIKNFEYKIKKRQQKELEEYESLKQLINV